MKDLTKIKTPFGLLGKKTRKALRAHGGPYESYNGNGKWWDIKPSWQPDTVYRVKPADPASFKPADLLPHAFCTENLVNLSGIVASQREHLEVIAAAPGIFAAVKEWQEARRDWVHGKIPPTSWDAACVALYTIVVPS